ncbi:MAG: oxygen-independent coproporphyrinogen III oxidase [Bacteriovoracaceae bacterium]
MTLAYKTLIEKYNIPGPRYTSYPPVPFWKTPPTQETWIQHILEHYDHEVGLDLYVHVPFCEKLCYYCGCNRIVTKNHSVEESFINSLLKEWTIYQQKLGFIPKVHSLHLGGGTPTFLSAHNLNHLIQSFTKNKSQNFIGSIEIDPRTVNIDHLQVLQANHFSRISLGIQDFDPSVQEAIHRYQSPEMVQGLVDKLKKMKFQSINFDLIYGLPKQTLASIEQTFSIVKKMEPDLIAFYSYAHLPERISNQKLIREEELPNPEEKKALYELGKKLLEEQNYTDIGMDHFAKETSYLGEAKAKKKLKRNFMGYVDKKSEVLIGLGPSSISDSSISYIQNAKKLQDYQAAIELGNLAIETGHTHSAEDLAAQKLIQNLMCQNEINHHLLAGISYQKEILMEFQEMIHDGLLIMGEKSLQLTEIGKTLMRNVAMKLDHHLREQKVQNRFSQTI